MSNPAKQERLAALRASIANIERRPLLSDPVSVQDHGPDQFIVPSAGLVQELFADERRNSAALLGFALGQARSLLTPTRRAVIYLQMLAEAQEMGLPYGPGIATFGFDPDALVLIRPANMIELLWAVEEALACGAVAAVIADIAGHPKVLDFTASRRLSLRADAGGTSLFLLRYGAWREASAAQLRWQIKPILSGRRPLDALSPGPPRWLVELEKGTLAQEKTKWLLSWTQDGFENAPDILKWSDRAVAATALSRAVSADMGDRLSQAG